MVSIELIRIKLLKKITKMTFVLALRCDAEGLTLETSPWFLSKCKYTGFWLSWAKYHNNKIALYYSAGSAQCYYRKIKMICVCIDSELLLFFLSILYFFICLLFFPFSVTFDSHFFKTFCSFFDSLQIHSHASFVLFKFLCNVNFFFSPFSNLIFIYFQY